MLEITTKKYKLASFFAWQSEQAIFEFLSLQFQSKFWCKTFHIKISCTDMLYMFMYKSNAFSFKGIVPGIDFQMKTEATPSCVFLRLPSYSSFSCKLRGLNSIPIKLNRSRDSNFNFNTDASLTILGARIRLGPGAQSP